MFSNNLLPRFNFNQHQQTNVIDIPDEPISYPNLNTSFNEITPNIINPSSFNTKPRGEQSNSLFKSQVFRVTDILKEHDIE